MRWLLRRLRWSRGDEPPLVCYLRENGPIAYTLALFDPDARPPLDAMFESGLAWYWRSASAQVDAREWTHLTRWSMAALLTDLAAQPAALSRDVTLLGIDAVDPPSDLSDDCVAAWLRGFVSDTPGPLHVVVRARPDIVFVAQQPPEAVRGLLAAWGIDRARAERRSYARLDGRNLESWLRSLTAAPHPRPPGA
jgi:hypothetical protein